MPSPFPSNPGIASPPAQDSITLSCHGCRMWFTVSQTLAGKECRCPGCDRKNLIPGLASPTADTRLTPSSVSFRHDPRHSEQWSVSLSEYRLPEPEEAESAPVAQALDLQPQRPVAATLLVPRVAPAAPPPPPPTGPETVEELLAGVQVTVVETNTTRQLLLQIAAVLIVGSLAAIYGPGLWRQGSVALGLKQQPQPIAPAASKSAKPAHEPRRSVETVTSSTTTSSSSSSGAWRPFQERPTPSPARPGAPAVVYQVQPASAPAPRYYQTRPTANASIWGAPVSQGTRITAFEVPPSDPLPGSTLGAVPAETSTPPVFVSAAPTIGYYQGGNGSGDRTFVASLERINTASRTMPEWMRLPTERWPQIMLLNEGSLRGHSSAEGTNCVLIEGKDNELWLATTATALTELGGVSPTIQTEDLRRKLVRWSALSPTEGTRVVEIKNGAGLNIRSRAHSFLMKVPPRSSIGDVKALSLRTSHVSAGDKLYLAVLPELDTQTQLVYAMNVTAAATGDTFRAAMANPVDASSFYGGALIDSEGRLAGIVVSADSRGQCVAESSVSLARGLN